MPPFSPDSIEAEEPRSEEETRDDTTDTAGTADAIDTADATAAPATADTTSKPVDVPKAPRADIFALLTRDSSSPADEPRPPIASVTSRLLVKQPNGSVLAYVHDLDDEPQPIDVATLIERDPYPLPASSVREQHSIDDDAAYWLSGLRDYLKIRAAVVRHGRLEGVPRRFLDLGCAGGRILRHAYCQGEFTEAWGCDIDRRNVNWVKKHLPPEVRVFQNSVYPSLPISEDFFGAISAVSVFTHIDTFEDAWLLELRRVLHPGGIACVTIHSERTWLRISKNPYALNCMVGCSSDELGGNVTKEHFDGPLPADRLVLTWPSDTAYRCNTFHSMQYVRENWGRFFEVCEIYDGGLALFQDIVVLRRA